MSDTAAPSPSGVLVIDKPLGVMSAAVCNRVKRRLRLAGAPKRVKVGHGGTLDPLATGVLVVLVGKATKLSDKIMGSTKVYEARVDLAHVSESDDRERDAVVVPVERPPTAAEIEHACAAFVGERVMQRPPAHSAIKIDGKRAFDLARAGEAPEMKPRPVRIDSIELVGYDWPFATLRITSGKGVYIRSLARDIGASLGAGGMLDALRRTRVGEFGVSMATPNEDPDIPLTQADLIVPDALRKTLEG